ncbi:MAG TPA: hypothetical protein VII19_04930, partial [Acidimicrobiales bacterium]
MDDVSAPFVERPVIDMFGRASYLEREDEVVGISRTPQSPRFDIEDQRLSILPRRRRPAAASASSSRHWTCSWPSWGLANTVS